MPSTVIKHFRYDPGDARLTIDFTSGATYEYAGVPLTVYTRFQKAFSKGAFFSKYIRDRYKFRKVLPV